MLLLPNKTRYEDFNSMFAKFIHIWEKDCLKKGANRYVKPSINPGRANSSISFLGCLLWTSIYCTTKKALPFVCLFASQQTIKRAWIIRHKNHIIYRWPLVCDFLRTVDNKETGTWQHKANVYFWKAKLQLLVWKGTNTPAAILHRISIPYAYPSIIKGGTFILIEMFENE